MAPRRRGRHDRGTGKSLGAGSTDPEARVCPVCVTDRFENNQYCAWCGFDYVTNETWEEQGVRLGHLPPEPAQVRNEKYDPRKYCRACGERLPTYFVDACPGCNVEVPLSVDRYIECISCCTYVVLDEPECPNCKASYSQEFWDAWVEENSIQDWKPPNFNEPVVVSTQPKINPVDINICCEQFWRDCVCENPIDASDVLRIQEAYEAGTDCMNCKFSYTPACPSLRRLARLMEIEKMDPLPKITEACASFERFVVEDHDFPAPHNIDMLRAYGLWD